MLSKNLRQVRTDEAGGESENDESATTDNQA